MEEQMEYQRLEEGGEEQKEPSFRSIFLHMEMALADYQRMRQKRWEKEEEVIFGLRMSQAWEGGKMEDPKAKKKRKKERGKKREKRTIKERKMKTENKINRKMDYYNARRQQKCDAQQRKKIRRGELEAWGIGGAGTDKKVGGGGDINLKKQKRSKRNVRNNSFYRDNG